MPTVKVKWSNGKTTLENLELDPNESPALFKAKLLKLTNVPVERQTLMFKGTRIDDKSWPPNLNFNEGDTLMLMGSSEKVIELPKEKTKFLEDMDDKEIAKSSDVPAGLINLGNTCYVSATVQCLRIVPEFRQALDNYKAEISVPETLANEPNSPNVGAALRDLYYDLGKEGAFEPMVFVRMIHNCVPRFSARGEGAVFIQQDANECWTELTRILQQVIKPLHPNSKYSSFIDEYFGGSFEVEMKCDEAPDEPLSKASENFLQLSCFISQDVRYLQSGLISRMKETITKFSPSLNRDASYTKTSKISRLPAYLAIQMVRFHYKGNTQTNAKLLRDVKFSMILDVYELCTRELQEKLAPMRAKYKKADDLQALTKSSKNDDDSQNQTGLDLSKTAEKKSKELEKFHSSNLEVLKKYSFEDDLGSNNSGFYELKSVLTHKGRSSSSGHYVAWIKHRNRWYKCDDEVVTPVEDEEILKLSGGGDWHCAYVLLYGPRYLELSE